jgi:hypothetical protein
LSLTLRNLMPRYLVSCFTTLFIKSMYLKKTMRVNPVYKAMTTLLSGIKYVASATRIAMYAIGSQ